MLNFKYFESVQGNQKRFKVNIKMKGMLKMFGKSKNKNLIKVMHYEGLMDFAQDYPCTIEMKDDVFEIKK